MLLTQYHQQPVLYAQAQYHPHYGQGQYMHPPPMGKPGNPHCTCLPCASLCMRAEHPEVLACNGPMFMLCTVLGA